MKALIAKLLFGRDKFSGILALGIVAAIALGCACPKELANLAKNADSTSTSTNSSTDEPSFSTSSTDDEDMPSRGLIDAMVGETTADFNFAIVTNDFTDMYEKASPNFQATYTEKEFKDTFKQFVENKRVVGPILSKAVGMEPTYSPDPFIRTEKGNKILVVNGKYDTTPVPMTFEYEYIKRGDDWKLLKFVVRLK